MGTEQNDLKVFTIGHGTLPRDELIKLLKQHEIKTLVDVRSIPYSQYMPDYNREQLERFLKAEGIVYKFAGEYLGGRPHDPTCYKNGKLPDETMPREKFLKEVNYRTVEKKDFYRKGIERLLTYARENYTAIMCSEEDPNDCHRKHLIGHTLSKQGVTLNHIRKDGTIQTVRPEDAEPEQLSLFPE